MRQRGARLDHDPVLATEIEQIPLREIRMQFGLHQGRLDPRGRNDLLQLVQSNIRYADRLAVTVVHKALERLPCLDQRHPGIVDDLTMLVPRVQLVAGFKGERRMNEIAIDGVDFQSSAAGVKGRLDAFGTMIGVP